jgi:hypothetical protein
MDDHSSRYRLPRLPSLGSLNNRKGERQSFPAH